MLRAAGKVLALVLGIPQWPPGLTEPRKVSTHTHSVTPRGKGLTVGVATLLPKTPCFQQKVPRHVRSRTTHTAKKVTCVVTHVQTTG